MQIKPTENLLQTEKKISKKQVRNKEGETQTESFSDLIEEIDVVELSSSARKKDGKEKDGNTQNLYKDNRENCKKEESENKDKVPHVNRFA